MNSQKTIIIVVVAAIVLIGAVLAFSVLSTSSENQTNSNGAVNSPVDAAAKNSNINSVNINNPTADAKEFTLIGKNYSFSLAEIRVKKGDKVKINLDVQEGFHDWVVDEFSVRISKVKAPAAASTEFVADKTGIFEYYCSVGDHRAKGMVGKLIVE